MSQELNKKNVGFVILTWNSEHVIRKCIESIVSMEKVIPKVIIVDNGSIDSTCKIVNEYIIKYPDKIKIIRYKENKGTTIPRNKGIKEFKDKNVDYYCILDSDTIINDETFIKLINELDLHKDYGMIGPKLISSAGLVQMSARAFPTLLEKVYKAIPIEVLQKKGEKMEMQNPPREIQDSYTVDYLMSACWLIKKEVIEKVGLLDEKIFYAPEDAEYCIRVWKKGYKVAYCPKVSIIHEWQRLSKKKFISKMNYEHIKGLIYMFNKHKYLFTTSKLKRSFKFYEY